jgi:hypothetical protein
VVAVRYSDDAVGEVSGATLMFIRYANISPGKLRIVDSDFFEEHDCHPSTGWDDLIDCYERRGLPVVPNLLRAWQEHADGLKWSLAEQVRLCLQKPSSKVLRYKDDIQKLMILM